MSSSSVPPDSKPPTPTIELAGPDDLATTWIFEDQANGEAEGGPVPLKVRVKDRYVLFDAIGVGAMGTVHMAKDQDLRRVVAYKTVNDPSRVDVTRRLLTEVQVTAQLDHPSVVPVYGLEISPSGGPAYAMKLVEGRTLSELLEQARDQLARTGSCDHEHDLAARLDIFQRICDALSYAHSKGVVHRDLKPPNIMLGPFGEVYVMDWGIARILGRDDDDGMTTLDLDIADDDENRTRAGQIFGTPAYMSPEQARGENQGLDHRSDVFGLGLLLYELVVLRRAYRSSGVAALLDQARRAELDAPLPVPGGPRPPRELMAIVGKATALRRGERYPSVAELADDVGAWLRGAETTALPDSLPRRIARLLVRRQRLVLALFLATLVVAGVSVFAVWSVQQQRLTDQALGAEQREARITALLREVDDRGQRIDNQFLWVEGQLEGLAAAAEYAFARGTPTDRPGFSAADYADPGRAPEGLVASQPYGKPIHPDLAVYTVAPEVPAPVWQRDLALADGLREHLHRMLLAPAPGSPPRGDVDDATWIAERGNPLVWVYIAIERSGLMYMAPGARGWDDRYDPRTRPWYRVTLGTTGNVWGTPYVDMMGTGRLLSATRELRLPDGGFLGVAGVDLQFEQVVERLVAADELPGYRTAYLVDSQGRVMVESGAKDRPFSIPATDVIDPGIDFGPARRAVVLDAAKARSSGHAEVEDDEGRVLVAWSALPSLDWTYVLEADLADWLAGE